MLGTKQNETKAVIQIYFCNLEQTKQTANQKPLSNMATDLLKSD